MVEFIRIKGLMIYDSDLLTKSPAGNPVITQAGVQSLTLNLFDTASKQIVWDMPLIQCVPALNGGIIMKFDNIALNFTNCYLKCTNAGVITAGQSAVLTWIYEDIRYKNNPGATAPGNAQRRK
jgi:hypothetical protein